MKSGINIDDPIGKTVGRRQPPEDLSAYGMDLQKTLRQFSKAKFPKGVFKFHSHEEADRWMMDHLGDSKG